MHKHLSDTTPGSPEARGRLDAGPIYGVICRTFITSATSAFRETSICL